MSYVNVSSDQVCNVYYIIIVSDICLAYQNWKAVHVIWKPAQEDGSSIQW